MVLLGTLFLKEGDLLCPEGNLLGATKVESRAWSDSVEPHLPSVNKKSCEGTANPFCVVPTQLRVRRCHLSWYLIIPRRTYNTGIVQSP